MGVAIGIDPDGKDYRSPVAIRQEAGDIFAKQLGILRSLAIGQVASRAAHPSLDVERISIAHDPDMDHMGYVEGNPVDVELTDGSVLSAWGKARGGTANPAPREEVVAKFRKVTARNLTPASQEAIIEHCARLDTAGDASALIAALQSAA